MFKFTQWMAKVAVLVEEEEERRKKPVQIETMLSVCSCDDAHCLSPAVMYWLWCAVCCAYACYHNRRRYEPEQNTAQRWQKQNWLINGAIRRLHTCGGSGVWLFTKPKQCSSQEIDECAEDRWNVIWRTFINCEGFVVRCIALPLQPVPLQSQSSATAQICIMQNWAYQFFFIFIPVAAASSLDTIFFSAFIFILKMQDESAYAIQLDRTNNNRKREFIARFLWFYL